MQNLATNLEPLQPCLAYGQVLADDNGRFTIQSTFGLLSAVTAAGCLVQPMPGDLVLAATDGEADAYILTVLKRAEKTEPRTRLVFNGPVDVVVNNGGFRLTADTDLTLACNNHLAMASGKISVRAGQGEAAFEKISFMANVLQGNVKRIKLVANTVENTFRRLTQRLQDAFRYVADHEEIQTGSTRYLVEDTLTMNSKNAVHMAEEIVTINAEQVHLG